MNWKTDAILSILDNCCDSFTFPMLDNGYVYLAATRLSLFRSEIDWALVIEIFGFSPRAGLPDIHIYNFASRLYNRDPVDNYVNREAYENYLSNNPHNDSRYIYPIDEGKWQDPENDEFVAEGACSVKIRSEELILPSLESYHNQGVKLQEPPRVQVSELCRVLASLVRDKVLATSEERRASVMPGMNPLLQLEEWNHPDVVDDDIRPSGSETFQQLAEVLATGSVEHYQPYLPPNTHWSNWPDGGSL